MSAPPSPLVAVASTFTAEPLEESLEYWMRVLDLPHRVAFAPYNQVFQALLDPSSLLSTNTAGINVILLRFVAWSSTSEGDDPVEDLVGAVRASVGRSGTPHLIVVCPSPEGRSLPGEPVVDPREARLVAGLAGNPSVHVVSADELATYAVERGSDPHADLLGRVPFTRLLFAALGTLIARKIHALLKSPHKVIVLDCDQTLWGGVCGEDGPLGVEISPTHRDLQAFMVAQHEAGMLLCLCSKNNEEDVLEVFRRRPEMPLRLDHFVSWRLNWQQKSTNLRSLASELNVGLDSFIFIDDNPLEFADVRAHCPEVLALQLPAPADAIALFLRHVWAFDRLRVTEEDRRRAALYRENAQRERFRHESARLETFLAGLRLDVRFSSLGRADLARAAQLTQRTNQFNFTTTRRSEGEIQALLESGRLEGLVVGVSDRFGDYGTVGLILFAALPDAIAIDTFLLSCRAMGRGVEHRMLARLGQMAIERGLRHVVATHRPTPKNAPAAAFLNEVGAAVRLPVSDGFEFRWPAAIAAAMTHSPDTAAPPAASRDTDGVAREDDAQAALVPARSELANRIATELTSPDRILEAIRASRRRRRPDVEVPFLAPRTPVEDMLAAVWSDLLDVDAIGIRDNFFELGGHSLAAILVMSRVRDMFDLEVSVSAIFENPTVEGLALTITETKLALHDEDTIARLLQELDGHPAEWQDTGAERTG